MNGQWECHSFDLNEIKLRRRFRDEGSGSGCELFTGCFYRLMAACRLCARAWRCLRLAAGPATASADAAPLCANQLVCRQGGKYDGGKGDLKKISLNIQINQIFASFIEPFVKKSVLVR